MDCELFSSFLVDACGIPVKNAAILGEAAETALLIDRSV